MRVRVLGYAFLITLIVFCLASLSWGQGADKAERVLFNAKVFTGVPDHAYAEAVAIRGDKIVAVGSLAEVLPAIDKDATRVDLQGKFLLPGLIDSHVHPIDGGLTLMSADLGDQEPSMNELVSFAADAKKSGKGMRGDVLYVSGMPLVYWLKTNDLNARFNSGDYATLPVFLAGSDSHTGWANRALLRRAGITKEFLSRLSAGERAYYGMEPTGDSNGFAVDAGLDKIQTVVPEPSEQQSLAGGSAAVHYLHSLGITAWLDAKVDRPILLTYQSLAQRGELTAHVAAFLLVNPRNDPTKELEAVQKLRQEFANTPNLTIPGIKVFADGVLE